MKIGVTLRNMGSQSTGEIMMGGAQFAEELGFESIWITDHIAIPPDDAQGSGGRYTDPLTTLAWLAGATRNINVAVGVLVLPYRPALPTAKQIATLQELSSGRLVLGVAVGWMDAEFRAVGVDRHQRGKVTDDTLAFFRDCFASDRVTRNGQPFIFSPRPPAPPIYIGGSAPQALQRALRFGHGWLPMVRDMARLSQDIALFRTMAERMNARPGPVTAMGNIPLGDPNEARRRIDAYRELDVERLVCGVRYETLDEYKVGLEQLANLSLRPH